MNFPAVCAILLSKEKAVCRQALQQMPFMKPHSKGGVFQAGCYLSARDAHPGLDRVGIIFFGYPNSRGNTIAKYIKVDVIIKNILTQPY